MGTLRSSQGGAGLGPSADVPGPSLPDPQEPGDLRARRVGGCWGMQTPKATPATHDTAERGVWAAEPHGAQVAELSWSP